MIYLLVVLAIMNIYISMRLLDCVRRLAIALETFLDMVLGPNDSIKGQNTSTH